MKINHGIVGDFPPLAWIMCHDNHDTMPSLWTGDCVEVHEGLFFEGAWADDFRTGRPDRCEGVFGSGGVLHDAGITLVPSLAMCDMIHWMKFGEDGIVASNSLALLLAATDQRLIPDGVSYDVLNDSILKGLSKYVKLIPTTESPVRRLVHQNMVIHRDGHVEVVEKPPPPRFPSYRSYKRYLGECVEKLLDNARDEGRNHPMQILTTQSRGYDTTAVNALASHKGIDLAVTVPTAKVIGRPAGDERSPADSDDGTEICDFLGIPIEPISRFAYRGAPEVELWFRAGVHSCQDLNLVGLLTKVRPPALLLTGIFGQIWYPGTSTGAPPVNGDLRGGSNGGHGLGEVRLEAGFVQAAIPFIGARNDADIRRITESSEMDPWRLNRDYDRPIPRRIAEEKGIPREWFGQRKMATVVERPEPDLPLTKQLRDEFKAWLVERNLRSRLGVALFPVIHRINLAVTYRNFPRYRLFYYAERVISRLLGRDWKLNRMWRDLRDSLYVYSVNELANRYVKRGIPARTQRRG